MSDSTRPAKRSRILTSEPPLNIPSTTSHSEPVTTTTCSNNNARRLAHIVTLRPLRQQKVAQTVLHHLQQPLDTISVQQTVDATSGLGEFGDLDFDTDVVEEENVEAPKRPVVRISCKLKASGSNFILRTGTTVSRLASSSKIFP